MEDNENSNINKLLERQQELKKKLVAAHRAGMSGGIINQIQDMISTVEFEIYNQQQLEAARFAEKNKDDDDGFIIG